VNERHIWPKSRWMIWKMIHCARPISLDIWRVEPCVCFWPSWLNRLYQFIHSSSCHVLFSTRVLWSAALLPVVGASCLPNHFSKVSSYSLLQFIFENSVTILREPYFFKLVSVLVSAWSSLLNGMLHYKYIVTALKIIIHNNIICFCLQTSEMYL